MFGLSFLRSFYGSALLSVEPLVPRANRPGTPLDYRVKRNRWPNGHKQARQTARLRRQAAHRQHLRYSAMPPVRGVVSGHILTGAMTIGE